MGRLISLITAAMALAACSNPTAPASSDRGTEAAKAKASLAAVASGGQASQTGLGRLSAN
jgi:hypothetical protein